MAKFSDSVQSAQFYPQTIDLSDQDSLNEGFIKIFCAGSMLLNGANELPVFGNQWNQGLK